ncbi:protein kinase domain-containing protein [Streptomyces niger]|uniref:protein kinase domain-containing protein n=1 Tax=Streptomyces niger TaxID=66373 RepID=UPI00069AE177|nr:protein kinase [Streptomyces niger]
MTHASPPDALAAYRGRPVIAKLLSDRRGSRAWEITGDDGLHLALKANAPDSDHSTDRDKAPEMIREAAVLAELERLGAVPSGYLQGSGSWADGQWLAVEWVPGRALWNAWALARGPEGDRRSVRPWMLTTARTLAARLAVLHAHGWTHADVQPTNVLVDSRQGAAHLIDYALACGPQGATGRRPYRGALTHTTAPEIAAAILNTPADTHIQAAPPADIWSLGATLYWCWTGQRPVSYADDLDRFEKLRLIATGPAAPVTDVRPWFFPALEDLITACMAPAPTDRPTAAELAHHLEETAP